MTIADHILKNTYTQSGALEKLRGLQEDVVAEIFARGDRVNGTGNKGQGIEILPEEIRKKINKDNVYELFTEAEKEIKKIEPLIIYVPVVFKEEQISQLGNWLRKNFGEKFLMELKFEPKLIAGCSLAWRGRMRDYSIKEEFDKKKKDLWTILSKS